MQNRLNITKTVRKYSIDKHLRATGSEFESGPVTNMLKHDDDNDEEYGEGSVALNGRNFDRISHQYVNIQLIYSLSWMLYFNLLNLFMLK